MIHQLGGCAGGVGSGGVGSGGVGGGGGGVQYTI